MAAERDVIDLQERLAFLERHIEELDGVLREMAERLDRTDRRVMGLGDDVRGRLDAMSERLSSGGGGTGGEAGANDDPGRDRPPHWDQVPGRSQAP